MNRLSHLGVAVATLALLSSSTPQHAQAASSVFTAHLTGREEVPAVQTRAAGEAKLTLSSDGTQILFRVNVADIDNVTGAAIHLGMPGQSGEAVAVLYGPVTASGGRKSGVLVEGTLTQASLTGSLMGHPLSDLVSAVRSGNVYVDVSTSDGSTTQKPGNESSGEIRGQVR